MGVVLSVSWHLLFAFEIIVWLATISELGVAGLWSALTILVGIPVLFMVEGLELAATALLAQTGYRIGGSAARELKELRRDTTFDFFPNRQIFVGAVIVLMTIANRFDHIYVPWIGWVADFKIPLVFNVLFSEHIVLLLGQVPPKRLALVDPPRFFRQSWIMCAAIRWIGRLQLTAPSTIVFLFLSRLLRYPSVPVRARPGILVVWDPLLYGWVVVPVDDDNEHEMSDQIFPISTPAEETSFAKDGDIA